MKKVLLSLFLFIVTSGLAIAAGTNIVNWTPVDEIKPEGYPPSYSLNFLVVTNTGPLRDIPDSTRLVKDVSLSSGYLDHLARDARWMTNTLVRILNGVRNNTYYLNYRLDGSTNGIAERISDLETEMDSKVDPINTYIENTVKPRMITSYQSYNSINYTNNTTTGQFITYMPWNHIFLSKLLEDDNRYASIYVNKAYMKDKQGYTLNIDEHINSPNFLPGKVYKLYFAGDMRYSLRILNNSKYNSAIWLLTPGLIKDTHYTKSTITNLNNNTYYEAIIVKTNLFSTYIVEIERDWTQMFITVKAGIEGLNPLHELNGVYNKKVNATVTFYKAKNIFNPLTGSGYEWTLKSQNKTDVQPAWKAIEAVLTKPATTNVSDIYTSATKLRIKVRYVIRRGNGGIGNPYCYTYSPNTSSRISKFQLPGDNTMVDKWDYSDQTIDLVKAGKTSDGKLIFRGYIRVLGAVTSKYRGYLVRIIPFGEKLPDKVTSAADLFGSDITRTITDITANPL